jgi:alkaline phosphatase
MAAGTSPTEESTENRPGTASGVDSTGRPCVSASERRGPAVPVVTTVRSVQSTPASFIAARTTRKFASVSAVVPERETT